MNGAVTSPDRVETLDALRHRRDHHARVCSDLLLQGRQSEALRHANESERAAALIRTAVAS